MEVPTSHVPPGKRTPPDEALLEVVNKYRAEYLDLLRNQGATQVEAEDIWVQVLEDFWETGVTKSENPEQLKHWVDLAVMRAFYNIRPSALALIIKMLVEETSRSLESVEAAQPELWVDALRQVPSPRDASEYNLDHFKSLAEQMLKMYPGDQPTMTMYDSQADMKTLRTEIVLSSDEPKPLTPNYLTTNLGPYLGAISEIQQVIDEILERKPRGIRIRNITQESPISVSLEGAAEAVQVVKDTVVPWRRKHVESMAHLLEQEKQAEIESKKAEVLERHASAAKGRAEADKLAAEVIKQLEEAEKVKLENEKLRLELQRAKIQLALDILNQLRPDLPETTRIAYLARLLSPLNILISSNLEISGHTKEQGDIPAFMK